ncbi:hypothetical protein ACH42_07865 [Endozoicomonas sp. (ex Bugula neritina AB1)]|nr:hypothetical protein ACH42_07865 [Endozoicomonas sp. (ex Bugula neritina AB1)]
MHRLLIEVKLLLKQRCFWGGSLFLLLFQLSGCSLAPEKVSLSQNEFQQAINVGFLAPQIRTFDFQPLMVVQLYLDTPSVKVGGGGLVTFTIRGKLDAEIFGGQVTEALPVNISGESGLTYDVTEQAIYMSRITLHDTLIDLDIALFRAMILSKFQEALSKELEHIPLIVLSQTPELEERLTTLAEEGVVKIIVEDENIVFRHAHP